MIAVHIHGQVRMEHAVQTGQWISELIASGLEALTKHLEERLASLALVRLFLSAPTYTRVHVCSCVCVEIYRHVTLYAFCV